MMPTRPIEDYPPRLFTAEVLEIARFGKGELTKRMRRGTFPKPIDRGARGNIFLKRQVLEALHIVDAAHATQNPFEAALNEIETA